MPPAAQILLFVQVLREKSHTFDALKEQLALPAVQTVGNGHFRKFFSLPNAQAVIAQGGNGINTAGSSMGGGGLGAGVAAAHHRRSSAFSRRPPDAAGMNHVRGTQ